MAIVISGVNNNDKITATDGTIDLLSGVSYAGTLTAPGFTATGNLTAGHLNIGSGIQLGNAGVATATTFVGNLTGNVNNTGNLLLQIGGGEKVRITSTGRVGINSTNPSAPLEIYTAASAAWKFRIDTTVSDGVGFYQRANGDFEMVLRDASNNVNYIAGTSGALQFATSGSERLQINSQGKPTFNTPGGDDAFLVKGDNFTGVRIQAARDSNSDKAMLQMLGSRGTNASPTILQTGDVMGTISARGYDGNSYAQSSTIFFKVGASPGDGDMPGQIEFATSSDGSESPSTRMSIDSNGFINQKFTSNNSTVAEGLFVNNMNNGTGNNASLIFSNDSGERKKASISYIDTGNYQDMIQKH